MADTAQSSQPTRTNVVFAYMAATWIAIVHTYDVVSFVAGFVGLASFADDLQAGPPPSNGSSHTSLLLRQTY